METEDLCKIKISRLNNFWTGQVIESKLCEILNEIKSDRHKAYSYYLRGLYLNNDSRYTPEKKKLPIALFCGLFENGRSREFLKEYSFLCILDIDKLGSEKLIEAKEFLLRDSFVFALWESPSRDGLKGLVYLKYEFDLIDLDIHTVHKIAFIQLQNYFIQQYGIVLDKSGNDITRPCFLSYEPDLILKKQFDPFVVTKEINTKIKKSEVFHLSGKSKSLLNEKVVLYSTFRKNKVFDRKTMKDIISYLTKNSKSITFTYDNWLKVAFAISSTFSFDVGSKYFIQLSMLDKDKYNEANCLNLLINCYSNSRGQIGFNTIIHLACELGFKYKNINAGSTYMA